MSPENKRHSKNQINLETMEPPVRRDINELLTQGYFKTARGRSPSRSSSFFYFPQV